MANVAWNRFHSLVLPNVQGCTIGIVDSAIRNACIEFCEKSGIWKEESIKTDVIAGENRYAFSPPTGTKVVECCFASINNRPLIMTTLQDLDDFHTGWRELEQDMPVWYFMDSDSTIRLVGTPKQDIDEGLEVHVILKPSRDAFECPDWIYEDWAEVIAHGALARLHTMVGRPWAQEKLVAYHTRMFRNGLSRARIKSVKSRQNARTMIKPLGFY